MEVHQPLLNQNRKLCNCLLLCLLCIWLSGVIKHQTQRQIVLLYLENLVILSIVCSAYNRISGVAVPPWVPCNTQNIADELVGYHPHLPIRNFCGWGTLSFWRANRKQPISNCHAPSVTILVNKHCCTSSWVFHPVCYNDTAVCLYWWDYR